MLRLVGTTLCGIAFSFGWPVFITDAFVQFARLLFLRSGHDWVEAFYLARRLESSSSGYEPYTPSDPDTLRRTLVQHKLIP